MVFCRVHSQKHVTMETKSQLMDVPALVRFSQDGSVSELKEVLVLAINSYVVMLDSKLLILKRVTMEILLQVMAVVLHVQLKVDGLVQILQTLKVLVQKIQFAGMVDTTLQQEKAVTMEM